MNVLTALLSFHWAFPLNPDSIYYIAQKNTPKRKFLGILQEKYSQEENFLDITKFLVVESFNVVHLYARYM